MKRSRFTDSQIMDALKRDEAGFKMPNRRLQCWSMIIFKLVFSAKLLWS